LNDVYTSAPHSAARVQYSADRTATLDLHLHGR
jgi:hypothetical protein